MKTFDHLDYQTFIQRVQASTGIRLSDYREDQMRRRIQTLAQRHGYPTFTTLGRAMEGDAEIRETFLNHMTINVTELFRNPELFDALAETLLPGLIKNRRGAPLSVWSAGCSYGAEAYTLGILLSEMLPKLDFRIKGTDVDLNVLAKAKNPTFSAMDMVSVSPARKEKHFVTLDDRTFTPIGCLKKYISFSPHDLLKDPYPNALYDLILCRNVIIYFTDEAKKRIFQGFFQALRPGGILFIGGTERLNAHSSLGFEMIRPFFYRKPTDAAALGRIAA